MKRLRGLSAATALAITGAVTGFGAAPAATASGISVERACNAPAPGYAGCYAVSVRGGNGVHALAARPDTTPPISGTRTGSMPRRAPAKRSQSSTPSTTPRPKPTSRSTGRRSGCRPARPPTAASGRSTRAASRRRSRQPTSAGAARSRSTSTWRPRSARSARSCWSRRRTTASPTSPLRSTAAATMGATVISNSYGGPESARQRPRSRRHYNHPGIPITVSSGDDGFARAHPLPRASPPSRRWAAPP